MKRAIEEDSRTRFSVRCDGRNRAFLSLGMLSLSMAMLVMFWWPGAPVELVAPWLGEGWGHSKAWMYVLFLGLVATSAALVGMYFGEWRRGYRVSFDAEAGQVHAEEWWEGEEVETSFPMGRFSRVEVHEDEDGKWMLSAVLENGSYWQLLDGESRQDLEAIAGRLGSLIEEAKGEEFVASPKSVEVEREEHGFTAVWKNRSHGATKVGFSVATALLAAGSMVPLLATFDGEWTLMMGTLALAVGALSVVTIAQVRLRGVSIAAGFWMGAVAAGVCGLGANWAYFPLATLGLWGMGSMTVFGVKDLWRPRKLWLEIDQWGCVYTQGGAITDKEGILRVKDLEGALANVHRLEPSTMWLVGPGGRRANLERCLRGVEPGEEQEAKVERLRLAGLSLFELISLSMMVDDEIRRRKESDEKIKIRPQF